MATAKAYKVSLGGYEIDRGNGYTTLDILKTMELYALNG